ncbi:MAG: peptidoglycan recognition family protein [Planctomycetota bacterium]|nr:peptidoglycan recognition family protein [Planctomycetota bacterium]
MCERIPESAFPPRQLRRRGVLAVAGAAFVAACAPTRTRRRIHCVAPEPEPPSPKAPPEPAYRVFTREDWGAEPLKDNHDPMNGIKRITLHHTAELPGMDTRTDLELVKGVQNFHRNERGWADIGYHWLIGRDGNVYEGRTLEAQGAHAGAGKNGNNLGISAVGDFTTELPSAKQLATIELFLSEQLALYEIPIEELHGHRDFKPTECPGTSLYEWLGAFKQGRGAAQPDA